MVQPEKTGTGARSGLVQKIDRLSIKPVKKINFKHLASARIEPTTSFYMGKGLTSPLSKLKVTNKQRGPYISAFLLEVRIYSTHLSNLKSTKHIKI